MAIKLFFPKGSEEDILIPLGKSCEMGYTHGTLTIWQNGNIIRQLPVSEDKGYEIRLSRKGVTVMRLKPPKKREFVISWLCGARKLAFVKSNDCYELEVSQYYDRIPTVTLSEAWENKGSTYRLFWTTKKGSQSPYCVAAFVSEAITTKEILELLPLMSEAGYPDWYIRKLLIERLGINAETLDKAMKKD